jgi:hypothetical protein
VGTVAAACFAYSIAGAAGRRAPGAPRARRGARGSIRATWKRVPGAERYEVLVMLHDGGSPHALATAMSRPEPSS